MREDFSIAFFMWKKQNAKQSKRPPHKGGGRGIECVLIVCNSSVFCNCTVGAVNSVITSVVGPITIFADSIPLVNCAFKSNARKPRAIIERQATNARDTIGDGDACQARAIIERIGTNARDAVGDADAC